MLAEFKEFVARGNMVDLAVAFVLGLAFQAVISTITARVLTPLIAMAFGEPNFDALLTFGAIDPETGVAAGSVGAVLTALLNFLLVAFVLFLVVKAYNRLKRRQEAEEEAEEAAADPEPEPDAEDVVLLRQIRDAVTSRDGGTGGRAG